MTIYDIYTDENFTVQTLSQPHVSRSDGGHVFISPKIKVSDRQALSPDLAKELMLLTIVVGEAMTKVMNERGIDIGRINYQDNGNWDVFKSEEPTLHIQIYGRAKSAVVQKYGQALYFPHPDDRPEFYEDNEALTKEDIKAINSKIVDILGQ